MKAEIKPFDPKNSTHYPIRAMDNPTAPIEHKGNALGKNLIGNTSKGKLFYL